MIEDASARLLALVAKPVSAIAKSGTGRYQDDAATRERYISYLLTSAKPSIQGQGGDKNAFNVACHGHDLGLPPAITLELLIAHWNSRCEPPWDTAELLIKVQNAYKYAESQLGHASPSADFRPVSAVSAPPEERSEALSPISGEELWIKEYPEPKWLVEELLPEQSCCFNAGSSGARKTWFELDCAMAVATGKPALGRFRVQKPGPVLIILGEDSLRTIRLRIQKLARGKGLDAAALKNMHFIAATSILSSDGRYKELIDLCKQLAPRLIVLDPFVRMHTCDENSAQEIQPILSSLRQLQRDFGVAIILTHHLKKNRQGDKGDGARKMELMRGSGDMGAWADTVFALDRFGEEAEAPTQVTIAKQRDVNERPPFMFTLNIDENTARLTYREDDAAELKTQDLMGQLKVQLSQMTNGLLKTELLKKVRGNNTLRRDALSRLEVDGLVEIRMDKRKAKDGKEREQAVVYLVSPTPANHAEHALAEVAIQGSPTPASPLKGAGVEGLEASSNARMGRGLALTDGDA